MIRYSAQLSGAGTRRARARECRGPRSRPRGHRQPDQLRPRDRSAVVDDRDFTGDPRLDLGEEIQRCVHAGAGSTGGGYAIRPGDPAKGRALRSGHAHPRGSRHRPELHQGRDRRRAHGHVPARARAARAALHGHLGRRPHRRAAGHVRGPGARRSSTTRAAGRRADDGAEDWVYDGTELPNVGFNAVVGRPVDEYSFEPDPLRPDAPRRVGHRRPHRRHGHQRRSTRR